MTHDRTMKVFLQEHIKATSREVSVSLAPNLAVDKLTVHEVFHDGLLATSSKHQRVMIPFASIIFIHV